MGSERSQKVAAVEGAGGCPRARVAAAGLQEVVGVALEGGERRDIVVNSGRDRDRVYTCTHAYGRGWVSSEREVVIIVNNEGKKKRLARRE